MAAFTSRLTTLPHLGQAHSLSLRVRSLLMYPQVLCSLVLGSNFPISKMLVPRQSALYFRNMPNIPQPTSLIDWESLWFFIILLIAKSSTHTLSYCLVIASVTLCKKSFRWLVIFSCNVANRFTDFFLLLPPFTFLETLRCKIFSRCRDCFRYFWFSNSVPSESTANVFIPKSIPTVVFVSVRIETKYFPAGVLLSVALLIIPLISRCKTILIPFLNFGIHRQPFSIVIFCGQRKDCLPDRVLKLGNLPRPLKKLAYAIARVSKAACKDWLLTSLSQVQSSFKSFNCTCKSYLERFVLCAEYAHVFVSKARLNTNLTQPKCLSSNSFCQSDGYKRYLFAFSTIQRSNI